jgi:diguanylate cyclase (GGDEF)-like protein
MPRVPPELAERIANDGMETAPNETIIQVGQDFYRPLFVPLKDIANRDIATVALLVNVSQEINTARLALLLGAIAYLIGGVLLFIIFYRLVGWIGQRIEHNEQRLEQLATVDQLTGLYNHRMFYSTLKNEIMRARRYGRPASLLMIDIDHFKRINDSYGHLAGDRVLERIGRLLKENLRAECSTCRYGGEEFAVILPEIGMEAAFTTAERLREIVAQTSFDNGTPDEIKITVSIGVSAFPESAAAVDELTSAADAALYAAKDAGRNRVVRYQKT